MQINHYENVKSKSTDLRYKIQALAEKYNPRSLLVEEREENGVKIKVYEAR